MPPWVRDRWVHSRVRRGSWYSSWASSTCRRPSWVRACWAKMSRISPLRSRTLTPSRLSSAFCWLGSSSSSATSSVKPVSALACASSSALPLPRYQLGSTWRRFCHSAPDDLRAGGVGEAGQLGERLLGGPARVLAGVDGDQERPLDRRREVDHGFRGTHAAQDTGSPYRNCNRCGTGDAHDRRAERRAASHSPRTWSPSPSPTRRRRPAADPDNDGETVEE